MIKALSLLGLIFWATALSADPLKVLFVGNSYLRYNGGVPALAEAMANTETARLEAFSDFIDNSALYQHELTESLSEDLFDLIVLQGHSTEMTTAEKRTRFTQALNAVVELISTLQPTAEIALYMTPSYTQQHPRFDPEMFAKVARGYREEAERIGAWVIPVGLAFELAYLERPSIALHMSDGSHPTHLGTYVAAATVNAAIFGPNNLSTEQITRNPIDPDDAAFLRAIAQQAVALERGCPLENMGIAMKETYLTAKGPMGDPIC
ncbi:MAG: DUF4886 domain-containing protein [Pseudomonadota bacterium]